jgi:hypothetical protein
MASFDAIADLPLEVESCSFEGLEITLGEFERLTTIVKLRGGGEEGIGEDVVYDAVDHVGQQDHGPPEGLAFSGTFAEFSEHLDGIDLFPAGEPEREEISRDYRRWAFESAALDLALRQAGTNLAAALGREPRPVNFVNSMRLAGFGEDEASSIEPLLARLAVYPTLRFKLDPFNDWDDELIAALAETGAVDSLDLKGFYKGTPVDVITDPELYAKLIEAFPDAWLEDPDVTDETRPLLEPVSERVTWDAPIHSIADIEAMPWSPPQTVNVKPSRFATSSPPTTTARSAGSAPTAAARPSSARAAARSSTSPRSSIPTPPTTSPPAATTTPSRRPSPACPRVRSSRRSSPPASAGASRSFG